MNFPSTHFEIKIVLPALFCNVLLRSCFGCDWGSCQRCDKVRLPNLSSHRATPAQGRSRSGYKIGHSFFALKTRGKRGSDLVSRTRSLPETLRAGHGAH
jgi:hypothetical protein